MPSRDWRFPITDLLAASTSRRFGSATVDVPALKPLLERLLTSALALTLRDRAMIAHELLLSLDEGVDGDAAEAWVAELE